MAIAIWNMCKRGVPGWPDIALCSPFKTTPYTFPLSSFPVSFQKDVDTWVERVTNPDPLDPDAPSRPLRPATVKGVIMGIRRFASALGARIRGDIKSAQGKIDMLVRALEEGGRVPSIAKRIVELENEIGRLRAHERAMPKSQVTPIPPDLGAIFRSQLENLAKALNGDDETRREAGVVLRQVFREVRVYPKEGRGNLAIQVEAMPHFALVAKESLIMLSLVAEEGLEPPTPGL